MDILSIPNYLPLFFIMYFVLYLNAYFILFRTWTRKLRPEACSCIISLAHGTPAVFLASYAILSDPNRNFDSTNTSFQNLVLEYSIAYFLMDLLHYLVFYPRDVLFIGHHMCTLFVFMTCRYVVLHGAYAILVLLILAEVTSLCQNVWTLASARRSDVKFAAKVYDLFSPPFYAFYSVVRGFVGPYFVYRMFVFYLSGVSNHVIPKWVWITWISVVVMAISVSILWISNLWIQLYSDRTKKVEQEKNR
ncbi:TLC domain-containing protein At5g14285-like [Olea europaea var. sylvestris]|uniref:TLC domain-containing protein At5g14285-like n=1 Tax=Olea europaea var. sylvestris TaxID=158386 RepID=UPI000C1D4127|nr:TLC domain-containing protein At5g14285-like [Olea europaea var. sylvestris]XP_022898743.1 TLC domain-containing protein At5g14285-like [Olea europaea var. sylvestris]